MYQPNYHPKSKAINTYESLLTEQHQQAEIEAKKEEIQEINQEVEQEVELNNIWQHTQAKRQNQTPTLLEVEEDDELDEASTSPASINTPPIMLDYKLIGINKVEQFNYLKELIDPSVKQRYQNQVKTIKLRGILAEANHKKIALILADIATNHRIAEIISVVVLPEYPNVKIGAKLIECLRTSLPKINCERLKLNSQAEAIVNKTQFSI